MGISGDRLLSSAVDFDWYKKELDVQGRQDHQHTGHPERFPCQVISQWVCNPNGADFYNHTFIYQQEIACEKCGHKTLVWPDQAE